MDAGSGLLPGFEACAVLARTRGRTELAASIRRLGTAIESGVILSFDDEAHAREVAAELEAPPFLGELAAALVAATLLATLGDAECAGYALLRLFRARQPGGDASFMTPTLLAALVEAPVAFDEHEDILRWAFATLAPAERAAQGRVSTVAPARWVKARVIAAMVPSWSAPEVVPSLRYMLRSMPG